MEVVVPYHNLIIHDRCLLPWVLTSVIRDILWQWVPRSTSYCRKTAFPTLAPARSGLEFDEKINNSLVLFVHGSVDLCWTPEFIFFSRMKTHSQCNCTLYGSHSMSFIVLIALLGSFSIYNISLLHTKWQNGSWYSESGRTMNSYSVIMIYFAFYFFPNDS